MVSYNVAAIVAIISGASVSAFFPIHQSSERPANRLSGIRYEVSANEDGLNKRGEQGDAPGIFISIAPFRSNTHYKVRSSSRISRTTPVIRDNQYQIVSAQAPSQSNSVAIDEDGTDYSYFSTATVGSKAEKMMLLIDTGSSVTWVMDDACTSGPCKMHNTFASSQSTTLKTGNGAFSLDYGTGEVSGSYASDTLSIAGMKVTTPIGLADKVSSDFQNYPFDGILGLGRIPLDTSSSSTFVQEVIGSKALAANVFGINLQRHGDGTADGELNFGAPDTSKYHGDLNWTDTVSDKSFWQVPADDILVDGKSLNLKQQRTAILDTGTSYMLIPPNDAKALFGAIKGATAADNGFWNFPCDTKQDIQVVIGGIAYSISPKDYIGGQSSGGLCQSNIIGQSAAGNDQTWLLGDTFLKNVYTVFDADKNRIGFGAKSGAIKVSNGSGDSSSTSASSGSQTAGSSTSTGSPPSSTSTKATITGGLGLPAAKTTSTAESALPSAGNSAGLSAPTPSTNNAGQCGAWGVSVGFVVGLTLVMAF